MNKRFFLPLLLGGEALIILRITAVNSISSEISGVSTGSATDWMLIAGVFAVVVGVAGMFRRTKPGAGDESSKVHGEKNQSLQSASSTRR